MDENLKFVLTLGAGAAAGAVIAGIFALIGAWVANMREHRQWLRNERLRAYETYLTESRPWAASKWMDAEAGMTKEVQAAVLQLRLVAPKGVMEATHAVEQQASDFRGVALRNLKRDGDWLETEAFENHVRLHLHDLEGAFKNLWKAMRSSLHLSRAEAAHWTRFVTDDAPNDDEHLAKLLEFKRAQK